MRLGVALPLADLAGGPPGPRSFAESAAAAERLGYQSIWTFDTLGGDFSTRFTTFEQQWTELQAFVADGSAGDRNLSPAPDLLGGPSLMLAGWRGGWVERAARESAGWIASAMYADDDQLTEGLARFRGAGGTRAIVTNVQVGEDVHPAIDRLHRLAEIGFDDAVFLDFTASEERLATIREAISP